MEPMKKASEAVKDGVDATEAVAERAMHLAEMAAEEAHDVAQSVTAAYERIADRTAETWRLMAPLLKGREKKPERTTFKQVEDMVEEGMARTEEMLTKATALISEITNVFGRLSSAGFDWATEVERVGSYGLD